MNAMIRIHEVEYRAGRPGRMRVTGYSIYATVRANGKVLHRTPETKSAREAAEMASAWPESPEALRCAEEDAHRHGDGDGEGITLEF